MEVTSRVPAILPVQANLAPLGRLYAAGLIDAAQVIAATGISLERFRLFDVRWRVLGNKGGHLAAKAYLNAKESSNV